MTKILSILFNLIFALAFAATAISQYIYPANSGENMNFGDYLLFAILGFFALHSLITIFKKLKALSKGSVVGAAFAIKRDLPLVAIVISLAASGITDFPWNSETVLYIVLSVIGIIGVICTASVAKKFF